MRPPISLERSTQLRAVICSVTHVILVCRVRSGYQTGLPPTDFRSAPSIRCSMFILYLMSRPRGGIGSSPRVNAGCRGAIPRRRYGLVCPTCAQTRPISVQARRPQRDHGSLALRPLSILRLNRSFLNDTVNIQARSPGRFKGRTDRVAQSIRAVLCVLMWLGDNVSQSLVTQRLDGIELGRFEGREYTGDDAHRRAKRHRQHHGRRRDDRGVSIGGKSGQHIHESI